MLGVELLVVAAVFAFMVVIASAVGLYIFFVKRRLERSRARALTGLTGSDGSQQLENLGRIERAIYNSEVFWKNSAGLIQQELFKELRSLVDGVKGFNTALALIPDTVQRNVPPAVNIISHAFEDTADVFRKTSETFEASAHKITSVADKYPDHLTELERVIALFANREQQFSERFNQVLEQRISAEQNLISAINEKAEKIRKGKVYIG